MSARDDNTVKPSTLGVLVFLYVVTWAASPGTAAITIAITITITITVP